MTPEKIALKSTPFVGVYLHLHNTVFLLILYLETASICSCICSFDKDPSNLYFVIKEIFQFK